MDRRTIYSGQVPLEVDLLQAQQNFMVGLAEFCFTVLGSPTLVDAFTVTPTIPATLDVILTPGNIYQMEDLEQTAWSSLNADLEHTVMKQGVLLDPQTMAVTPPVTFGYSQVYLVEVAYQDLDTGALVLPYFNAANPQSPFAGPGNQGAASNTIRQGKVAFQLKAGIPAPTGTQLVPAADPGWTALYTITVGQGDTTITAGNIELLTTAPYLATLGHLPQIPNGVQNWQWSYCEDTSFGGTAPNTDAVTSTGSAVLQFATVPTWVKVGMTAYDLTTPTAITGGQTVSAINFSTNQVTLSANVNATVNSGDAIAFSSNQWVGTVAPIPLGLTPGLSVRLKIAGTNTAAPTFNLNGLGAVAVHRANGSALQIGDAVANMIADLVYDGSAWQLINFEGFTSTTTNNNTFTLTIPYTVDTSVTPNTVTAPFSPAITSLSAGTTIEVKIANQNTGDTHITVNALSPVQIVDKFGNALGDSAVAAGEVVLLIYDGTRFQIVNSSGGASTGNGLIDGQSYTVHGTYTFTVPAGVYSLWVRVVGAGGGFFNNDVSVDENNDQNMYDDPGGAAGGYSEGIVAVTPGQTVTVTVGQGGQGVNNSGNNGTSSSFGAFLSATGGTGGIDTLNDTDNNITPVTGGVGTGGSIINSNGGTGIPWGNGGAGPFGDYPSPGAGASSTFANTPAADGAVIIVW